MPRSEISLPDLKATEVLAKRIAPHIRQRDCIALTGDLGAGKTEFARFLLRARGVKGDVPSPTFTLVQTYELPDLLVTHFDLYRLKSSNELDELGWDDALSDGAVIVEWPERGNNRIPPDALKLHFMVEKDGDRRCVIDVGPAWAERLGIR